MTIVAGAGELPMLWRAGAAIARARFAADLAVVERAIPPGGSLLNLCKDRYHFALLFLAACRRGATNLLPPSEGREDIAEVGAMFSAPPAIDDAAVQTWLAAPAESSMCDAGGFASAHEAAIVFTSGSTGQPSAYRKTWGTLEATAASSASAVFGDSFCHVVATVPPQHMYGLEFSVMMALNGRAAVHAGRPLFPADVAATLDSIPAPRVLVTTPVHLRALVGAEPVLPPLHRVICATAPLDGALAEAVERTFGCELHEVYGCTEAGSVALRRTTRTSAWRPHSVVRVTEREGRAEISGSHLPSSQQLQD
ncbi:MAG: AMP-binding protein, partial [Panacagrimonas sp.]